MPRFRIRFIGGLILLVILSCLFFGVQYSSNALVSSTYNWVRSLRSLYDAEQELELVEQHERAVRRSQMSGRLNRIVLYAEFMKGTDESGIDWDAASPFLMEENRALIRVTESGVKLPSGMPEDLSVNPLQFTRTKGWVLTGEVDEPLYAVYYYRMGNSAWFISWDPYDSSPLGIVQAEKREKS